MFICSGTSPASQLDWKSRVDIVYPHYFENWVFCHKAVKLNIRVLKKVTLRKGWNKIMYLRACCKPWGTREAGCMMTLKVPLASCLPGNILPSQMLCEQNGKVCETSWPLTRTRWLNVSRTQRGRVGGDFVSSWFLTKTSFVDYIRTYPRQVPVVSSAACGVRMVGWHGGKISTNLQWRGLIMSLLLLWNLSDELFLRDHLKQLFSQCTGAEGMWGELSVGRPELIQGQAQLVLSLCF